MEEEIELRNSGLGFGFYVTQEEIDKDLHLDKLNEDMQYTKKAPK